MFSPPHPWQWRIPDIPLVSLLHMTKSPSNPNVTGSRFFLTVPRQDRWLWDGSDGSKKGATGRAGPSQGFAFGRERLENVGFSIVVPVNPHV